MPNFKRKYRKGEDWFCNAGGNQGSEPTAFFVVGTQVIVDKRHSEDAASTNELTGVPARTGCYLTR